MFDFLRNMVPGMLTWKYFIYNIDTFNTKTYSK